MQLAPGFRPRWIAALASAIAVLMASWYGVLEVLGLAESRFDPGVAILTATLIAAIWYTNFTYESLDHARTRQRQERARARASLATALLSELQWLYPRLENFFKHPTSFQGSIAHPVLDEVVRNAALFEPETTSLVVDVYRILNDLEQEIGERDQGSSSRESWIRPFAGSACHQIIPLVERLYRENGLKPRQLRPRFESELPPLPEDPFESRDEYRARVRELVEAKPK